MDARRRYEQDVLCAFARLAGRRRPGLADQDRDREFRAQQLFYDALGRFREAVIEAHPLTDLRSGALSDLLDTLSDATPDRAAWDEAIMETAHD